MAYSEEDFLALSGIQHYFFCRRQWALIHVEKQWVENVLTAEGRLLHNRVDNSRHIEYREGIVVERSMPLKSAELGIYGVADVVEFHREDKGVQIPGESGLWLPRPVEYKRGKPKAGLCDKAQLCAQAACMEEAYGVRIDGGDLFYWQTRRRLNVVFDDELRKAVRYACDDMHKMLDAGMTPAVPADAACKNCSMAVVCLPVIKKKSNKAAAYVAEKLKGGEDAQTT